MLKPDQPIALYLAHHLLGAQAKMGHGVLRYAPNPITCVIDPDHAGKPLQTLLPWSPRQCPIVADVAGARRLGAEVLVLGLAPLGGRMPDAWRPDIETALMAGMCIVNGLHEPVTPGECKLRREQYIWNIRREPPELRTGTGAAASLPNRRVLTIGTDMAVGKMTAALQICRAALKRKLDHAFVATGQIGITVSGSGVPLDAIRLDFAAGAIERAVLEAKAELVLVEGQGSLLHPSSSATLPLLRGACPTHFVLCHRAGQESLKDFDWVRIPPLAEVVALYQELATAIGAFPRPRLAAVALNTQNLSEADARRAIDHCADELGVPVSDAWRFAAEPLLDGCLDEAP